MTIPNGLGKAELKRLINYLADTYIINRSPKFIEHLENSMSEIGYPNELIIILINYAKNTD